MSRLSTITDYWETGMVIKRSALESIDFSDIDTGDTIPDIHPGEILRSEFLEPLGMSVNALALALRVPAPRINDVVRGKRAISADTALRLQRYFGASAQFWLNLQIAYDLRIATAAAGEQIEREIEPMPRADRPTMPKVSAEHARAAALAVSVSSSHTAGKAHRKA
jgi:addiction module HigA family antidote